MCALGIGQITAWGTGYYCLGVLAGPIGRDTGWSLGVIYFGFTLALLVMGAVLIPFGLWAFGRAERYAKRTGKLKRVG